MFKEIKQGQALYVLNKDSFEFTEFKVESVSSPRLESKPGFMPQMVVDITTANPVKTYVLPSESNKGYTGQLILSDDKSLIVGDLKVAQDAIERSLNDVPKKKADLEKIKNLLADLDTEFKERQQLEKRISGIESKFDSMESMIREMYNRSKPTV